MTAPTTEAGYIATSVADEVIALLALDHSIDLSDEARTRLHQGMRELLLPEVERALQQEAEVGR